MSARARWISEFEENLPLRRQFILHGNIHDIFTIDDEQMRLVPALQTLLKRSGYQIIGHFDILDGLTFPSEDERSSFATVTNGEKLRPDDTARPRSREATTTRVLDSVRRALQKTTFASAFIIDFASLLLGSPNELDDHERTLFLTLSKSAEAAVRPANGPPINLLIVVAAKLNDLPAWLYIGNPLWKPIEIDRPADDERRAYIERSNILCDRTLEGERREELVKTLTDLTSGMMLREVETLREIARHDGKPLTDARFARDLVHRYRFGERKSPWAALSSDDNRRQLANAKNELGKWVKGQSAAIDAVIDVLKRSSQGLSGVQHTSRDQRPKGVLFFAGPTGVGKTELARAIARLLFSSPDACIRFDMSEYAQEHSDQKFFGAPPGYVGYEQGGQLTNRVKAQPFSVLLFDEIEKAHPRILDKFLQILDDGRLTSGQGETVYFSESLIIFTSNKGIYTEDKKRKPVIQPKGWKCKCSDRELVFGDTAPQPCAHCRADFEHIDTPYDVIEARVHRALDTFFKIEIGRPELFNRIGDNFVVFDFIRPEVMKEIVDKMLAALIEDLRTRRRITLDVTPVRQELILRAAKGLDMGGRGAGNVLEKVLINPLARHLFDERVEDGASLRVDAIIPHRDHGAAGYALRCTPSGAAQ